MRQPIIEFNHFTFKYYSQTDPTLRNIDVTIYQGEKVLILGPSGSGKSTLVHCLNGLVPFSYKGDIEGELLIKGSDTRNLDIFTLSQMVGTVLQDTDGQFIGLNVGEDIAFSLENERIPQHEMKTSVQQVAELVEIEHHMDHSIHELSGGQKQRVSVGGVMVNEEVEILLFDEPLANLDPATGQYAMELIDRIHQETSKTIIMIEHRLEDALHIEFDRVIVLHEGEVFFDGAPNQLLASHVLNQVHIREPLYLKALKYSGCKVDSDMGLEHIDTLNIADDCKQQLKEWSIKSKDQDREGSAIRLLEVKNLDFRYQHDLVLQNISFSIRQGEMVSIVGKNGAGKSTLSKLICGFEKMNSGQILLEGEDITNQTIFERASQIGFVLQNPNHMISKHMIYDEVALGLVNRGYSEKEIEERVWKTLKVCGLYPFRNWPISALSYGQKKRVTIASILVLEPNVIILDEPTAGQDFRHYTEMMEFLLRLNDNGTTIVFITHDMHLMLEYTSRSIVLADGRLIADQSAVDVLTNDEIVTRANLKRTSLFDIAVKVGISDPKQFVHQFISYDREVRARWL
ncbi:ATP-binding cassette domain-containing protein [Gracilibacillus salitolerans]|uniref:ATP-binding cassette domain-containing protein n=1 Tax=Gracilibacillus salitolerans TaxID=2663022 RepID=A0A5Q2TMT2_9BACI|nr:ABC transporter ATP-binding protein [Gracilibacillus salitolerans]QGH36096.1 ATP-binding cassette domain-containing protein [Gracilibacillus salitolerans]